MKPLLCNILVALVMEIVTKSGTEAIETALAKLRYKIAINFGKTGSIHLPRERVAFYYAFSCCYEGENIKPNQALPIEGLDPGSWVLSFRS